MAYRIYVGNLPIDIREREIDDLFYKYGRIRDIDLKTPSRPPAFAFVSFEYQDDADAAIRGRDGYDFDGNRLRVEYSKGSRGGERGDRRGDRDRGRGGGRRSEWQVIVTKLPRSASWQDLKDFMRRAGDVIYADVDRNGDGVVEYSNEEDMENAVRKLDDTEFKNPFDKSFVRVRYADERKERRGGSRDRSRSRDRDRRSRSRDSRSPSRSDSRDRKSRKDRSPDSRSPARDRKAASRSRSDSRGRSPRSKERKSVSRSRSPSGDKDRKRSVSGSRE